MVKTPLVIWVTILARCCDLITVSAIFKKDNRMTIYVIRIPIRRPLSLEEHILIRAICEGLIEKCEEDFGENSFKFIDWRWE